MRIERINEDITLYNGDCRDILPELREIDLIATDPPYGCSYVTNHRKVMNTPEKIVNDDYAPLWCIDLIYKCLKNNSAAYLFTRFDVYPEWFEALNLSDFNIKTPIVWDKNNWTAGDLYGDYGNRVELILFAHKGRHLLREGRDNNLWSIPRDKASDHPTPKPVELMERIIRNSSNENEIVCDPFMGSGSTGLAAYNLNRKFIGIELDNKYFDLSCKRIEKEVKLGRLDNLF